MAKKKSKDRQPYELSKLIYDMPSETYHTITGTYSSSQLKDMEEPEVFHAKYIAKTIPREHRDVFDVGNYFHTGLLEPHKLEDEFAIYPGAVRRGEKFERFARKNKGKIILTATGRKQGENLIDTTRKSEEAMRRVEACEPEVSLFIKLRVHEGKIYAVDHGVVLTMNGWTKCKAPSDGTDIVVKVRADMLLDREIADLKSTSGSAASLKSVKGKIRAFKYELSASLYVDLFSLVRPKVKRFTWVFTSKDKNNCGVWETTRDMLRVGRVMWAKAVIDLAEKLEEGFEDVDKVRKIAPDYFERGVLFNSVLGDVETEEK